MKIEAASDKPSWKDLIPIEDEAEAARYLAHLELIEEAGFTKSVVVHVGGLRLPQDIELTWPGHEFLDDIRDPGIWDKAKERTQTPCQRRPQFSLGNRQGRNQDKAGAAMNQLVPISSPQLPTLVVAAGERASIRFLEFVAANIRNPHTRRAYYRAAQEFLAWCASVGVPSIVAVQPVHVAVWIEGRDARAGRNPSVKQRLAALRPPVRLAGQWSGRAGQPGAYGARAPARRHVRANAGCSIRPEARALLDSIDVSTQAGLRGPAR